MNTTKQNDNLVIIADFDGTLTKHYVDGEVVGSSVSVLRRRGRLGNAYTKRSQELLDHYYPIEKDPSLSLQDREDAMVERRTLMFENMFKNGFHHDHVKRIIDEGKLQPREGRDRFIGHINKNNIPLIILSASGVGSECIRHFLDVYNSGQSENIFIISNEIERNQNGYGVKALQPIIHSYNKQTIHFSDFPRHEKIKSKSHGLIMGDSLGDIFMGKSLPLTQRTSFGFIKEPNPTVQYKDAFYKTFDHVIENDGSFDEISKRLQAL